MPIEFNKITEQVYKMGSMIEQVDFDFDRHMQIALRRFASAGDVDAVRQRIQWVRQSDISGYRGAALLGDDDTPPNLIYPPPQASPQALVIAADGSQVYPSDQSAIHYYLINIGLFMYYQGAAHLPEQITLPTLYFHKSHVHDRFGHLVSNRTVDARRTVAEMQAMSALAWERRHSAPAGGIVALYDNSLMFTASADDVTDADDLQKDYHAAMQHLYDIQANGTRVTLAGYVDNPRGSVVLRLLHLLSLRDEAEIKFKQAEIERGGDLEGLRDRHLFHAVLSAGERSAVMVQNSPRNLDYKRRNPSQEIAFFYVKVGVGDHTAIARVDIPAWVAAEPAAVDDLHAVLLAQSAMQGRNPYPYALTRADELAYVGGRDKAKLNELINIELRRKGLAPALAAPKARGKELARSEKTRYEVKGDLR
ncbi:MAG: DNA double-strand break repair nuclease NurA [Anaerolineaceae bacterium]|nr:MAG: DNA double-strand break repair nuclease NurA [Anaerolineaceae bacterium]